MLVSLTFRTAFLDRDGVINRKPAGGDYVKSWEEFEFLPGVFEALRILKQSGFRLIVVTNQRGISLGKLSEDDLHGIHDRMMEELRNENCLLDAIYYCPHDNNSCVCRKPEIGLFLEAQQDFPGIKFAESVMIGDSIRDMEAGERLGCRKVAITDDAAGMAAALARKNIQIHFTAPSLLQAATLYLAKPGP